MQHSTVSHVFFFFAVSFAVVVLFGSGSAMADPSDWAEGTQEHNDGANREHYNQAASLRWAHFMGDWCDSKGTEQGEATYAIAEVSDTDTLTPVRWDVTTLANEWGQGTHPNQGMFLRVVKGSGRIAFASRESTDETLRPKLELSGKNGTAILDAVADTFLTKWTYHSQGQANELRVSAEAENLLVRFDLEQATDIGTITRATLVLQSPQQFGSASIGVFRCDQGEPDVPTSPILGIAANYENDRGITNDPDVIFATGFEQADWKSEWTQAGPDGKVDTVNPESRSEGFLPLQGKALRSRIDEGEFTALNTLYKFNERIGSEPEEIYFRYHLRLADDWNQTVQGGKLPGISGTYGRAGWGGRKSNGTDGWSARGLFQKTIPAGNPLAGRTPIGFYCYHADMKGSYGSHWVWSQGYRGYLATNRWYTIEQHCRLNTPGEKDGILRGWVDGLLAFEKTDVRFRMTDELKIEQIWMNLYHGGKTASPHDQHIFIDNVVVAKKHIGPRTIGNANGN